MDAPKRYAVELVGVLDEDPKDFSVAIRQLSLHLGGQAVGIRIKLLAKLYAACDICTTVLLRIGQNRDIQFRDHELDVKPAVILEHGFNFVDARII